MSDTIESFVAKLKSEGVDEGRRQAEQLRAEAQQESDRILAEARAQGDKVIAEAQAQADSILARGHTELELAARDAVLKLHEALERILREVLGGQVETQLSDAEFVRDLIQSILQRYIDADIDSYAPMKINVAPEMRTQLCDWALGKLRLDMADDTSGFDFRDTLREAGFEFSLHGATIEVTRESVLDTLMQMVSPSLREVIRQASQSTEGA